MKNGMIAFMRDQTIPGPVMLDIEITNTFPIISLTETTQLIYGEGEEMLKGCDHISIPSDFRLHITGEDEHIFFDVTPVLDSLHSHNNEAVHYFTIIGLPASMARDLVKQGETRTWHEVMIISPFKDGLYNDSTRLFVDFFLHNSEIAKENFVKFPFVREECVWWEICTAQLLIHTPSQVCNGRDEMNMTFSLLCGSAMWKWKIIA